MTALVTLAVMLGLAFLVIVFLTFQLSRARQAQAPDVQRIEQQIEGLHRRLDEWQRATATQQQVGEA